MGEKWSRKRKLSQKLFQGKKWSRIHPWMRLTGSKARYYA